MKAWFVYVTSYYMKLEDNLVVKLEQDNSQSIGCRREPIFLQTMLYGLSKGWLSTLRPMFLNAGRFRDLLGSGKRFVFVCWHSDVVYLGFQVPKPTVFIISPSKDGDILAGLLERWGYEVERGSRKKGGVTAIKRMAQLMEGKGLHAGIVADGSRGPAHRVQNGPVILARDTGAWLFPVAMAAKPMWRAGSWDRTKVPLPFARVVIAHEEPFAVPESVRAGELVFWKKRLEEALNNAEQKAEDVLK